MPRGCLSTSLESRVHPACTCARYLRTLHLLVAPLSSSSMFYFPCLLSTILLPMVPLSHHPLPGCRKVEPKRRLIEQLVPKLAAAKKQLEESEREVAVLSKNIQWLTKEEVEHSAELKALTDEVPASSVLLSVSQSTS
eukprot:GHVU01173816.1.p3 GENE.GHVU01173816.1~~GHVU01173816.1.p3  ORF type:complete len:138 (-),score=13.09 GHVU01173816.1:770-1183(-)